MKGCGSAWYIMTHTEGDERMQVCMVHDNLHSDMVRYMVYDICLMMCLLLAAGQLSFTWSNDLPVPICNMIDRWSRFSWLLILILLQLLGLEVTHKTNKPVTRQELLLYWKMTSFLSLRRLSPSLLMRYAFWALNKDLYSYVLLCCVLKCFVVI